MRNLSVLIFVFVATGCGSLQRNNEISFVISDLEIKNIQQTILDGYDLHHAKFFSAKENCLFENFIRSELSLHNENYDNLYRGVLLKYYYCPYNNFYFTILKGKYGLYYYGLMDIKFVSDIEMENYTVDGSFLVSANIELEVRKYKKDGEVLEQIIETEFGHLSGQKLLATSIGLLNQCYKSYRSLTHTYETFFSIIEGKDELDLAVESLSNDFAVNEEVQNFIDSSLASDRSMEQIIAYKLNNSGIFFYTHILNDEGEINVDLSYILEIKKWIRLESDLIRPDQYDCS